MPSLGNHYYMSQHKLALVVQRLSDMLMDNKISEEDYEELIPIIVDADEEAFSQKVYVTTSIGHEDIYLTGIFTEPDRAYEHVRVNEDTGIEDAIHTYTLNDPDADSHAVYMVGFDEYGDFMFEERT